MKKVLVLLLMFAMVSSVFACRTDVNSSCEKIQDYFSVKTFLAAGTSCGLELTDEVSWTHDIDLPTDITVNAITEACLRIDAFVVTDFFENDTVGVYYEDVYLGDLRLCGLPLVRTATTFNLGSYLDAAGNQFILDDMLTSILLDGGVDFSAELKFVRNNCRDTIDVVKIMSSSLCMKVCQVDDNNGGGGDGNPTVPAPGAVLLSGFGTVIVGAVRRRKL